MRRGEPGRGEVLSSVGRHSKPADASRATRKTVTVLFADMSGSTALGERLDPEALRVVIERYFDGMKAEIERHGGLVEKLIGEAVMPSWVYARASRMMACEECARATELHQVLVEGGAR